MRRSPTGCGPTSLDEVVGQEHLTGPDGAIGRMVAAGQLASMILWGPPGTGKTSIARLLADAVGLRFVAISAVFSGVADLKKIFAEARTDGQAPASRPCCSWTRSTASTARSRTASCPMSRTAPSPSSARPPRTRASSSTPRLLSRCQVLILRRLDHAGAGGAGRPRRGDRGAAAAGHRRSARRADRQRRRRRPLPAQPGRDPVLVDIDEPLGPAELSDAAAPPRAGLRQGPRGPLQPHLGAAQKRSAARTRRRRFIISRGCSSPARSRSTCSAA